MDPLKPAGNGPVQGGKLGEDQKPFTVNREKGRNQQGYEHLGRCQQRLGGCPRMAQRATLPWQSLNFRA